MRDPDGNWYGFSSRARVIVYNKAHGEARQTSPTYESLADPKNKGKICTRSGSHPYNLSLIGCADRAQRRSEDRGMGEGVVANMARTPRGGDTDQIKGVAAGECAIALSNTYYYVRLLRSTKPEESEIGAKTGVVWPDQASYGTHVNISGAGVLKNAPHRENAIKFLEYLASDAAQALLRQRQQRVAGGARARWRRIPSSNRSARSRPIRCRSPRWARTRPRRRSSLDRAGWK